MPSIVELGAMRRALSEVQFDLNEGAEGDAAQMQELPGHLRAYDQARRRYLDLPSFPGEPDLWAVAQSRVDAFESAGDRIRAAIEARQLRAADASVTAELAPALREADQSFETLIRFNHDQGKQAALDADVAWARARHLSLVADIVCAAITGAFGWFAYRRTRRFMWMQKVRADELEAFASRVAHDVRGPLTPVLFTLQMFERDFAQDEKRLPLIERSIRSLKRVDQLIEDLLTFSRAAAVPDRSARASLSSVITGVMQDLEREATVERVRLEVGEMPGCEVACAPGVLSSIVMNLVSNAIKHMPPEAEERRVAVRALVADEHVRVEVADTGAGLPALLQEKVFEPYVRVDRRRPGLGLGLATVQRLVRAHGGHVGVESHEGAGAVFWFELPVCELSLSMPERLTGARPAIGR